MSEHSFFQHSKLTALRLLDKTDSFENPCFVIVVSGLEWEGGRELTIREDALASDPRQVGRLLSILYKKYHDYIDLDTETEEEAEESEEDDP